MKSATNLKYTLRQFYYYANTLFFYGMCATGVNALAESTDYYWRGGSTWDDLFIRAGNVANWKADAEGNIPHSTVPSETSNLIFDVANMQRNGNPDYARVNWYVAYTSYPSIKTVNSVTAYVPLEIHITSSISLLGDWHGTVSSDSKYTPSSSDIGSRKSMRLVADTANFLTVGGDMALETDKYFNSRFRLGSTSTASASYTLAVKGALNFIKNGSDTVGYHTFDMAAYDTTTGTYFSMDLGGLSSSGKAVYMTSAKNLSVNINFMSNGGVFKGGDFEGVFATESGVSSNLSINMSGDGRQSMTIYKASNASLHGFENDLDGKTDMAINSVEVNNGELVLDSELSVGDVRLLGGALKLSAPKVERIIIDGGGKLIYSGAIVAGELSVYDAPSVDVVFSAEDLKNMEITIFEFDNLTDEFDVNSVFSAYGESGEELGGEFSLIGEVGGPGSLIYTVPEAAELASIFGLVALLFAVSRRRK